MALSMASEEQRYIDIAMRSSTMLTLEQFREETKYDIAGPKFWDNLYDDMPVYLDNATIAWMGYQGATYHQREHVKKLLQHFQMGSDYWMYSTREYKEMLISISSRHDMGKYNYPPLEQLLGKNKMQHIVLTVDTFKHICMMLTTDRAHEIRCYYIAMERMVKTYMKYQLRYREHEAERFKAMNLTKDEHIVDLKNAVHQLLYKVDDIQDTLEDTNEQLTESKQELTVVRRQVDVVSNVLGAAIVDRSLQPENKDEADVFCLYELMPNDQNYHFYAIRRKRRDINRAVTALRHVFVLTNREPIRYECHPNAMILYRRIKDQLRGRVKFDQCRIRLLDISASEFLSEVARIEDERRVVNGYRVEQ
jgi:phage anti-repressor protein